MTTYFWTDPHLGLNRTSHTTPASRKALRDALTLQAKDILKTGGNHICLGDLFDTTENDEQVIADGAEIANQCELILSGNHDLPNREGKMSSLELIGHLSERSMVAIADTGNGYFNTSLPGCSVTSVPHKRSQVLFDTTLECLYVQPGVRAIRDTVEVLILHCNYNSPFATQETSLNLSREQAERLLDRFDYILIGHEHTPRSDFDGRLQVLGNIHPTSFADISDKYLWYLDGDRLAKELIWSVEQSISVGWEDLLRADSETCLTGKQFIEVTGIAPATKLPEIAKAIQKLWSQAPDALMIRNNVKSESLVLQTHEVHKSLDVPTRISKNLAGTHLEPLWKSYLEKVNG